MRSLFGHAMRMLIPGLIVCIPSAAGSQRVLLVGLYDTQYTGDSSLYEAASVFAYDIDGLGPSAAETRAPRFLAQSAIGFNPSWIIPGQHKSKGDVQTLYTVSEAPLYKGKPEGSIASLELSCDSRLRVTSRQGSGGGGPVFLSTDHEGTSVFCANYVGGSVGMLPVIHEEAKSVTLGELHQRVDFGNTSTAHSVVFAPGPSRYAFIQTLGLDQVHPFQLQAGKLTSNGESLKVSPGQGPRHLAFHPSLPFAVLANEGTGPGPEPSMKTIILYGFDAATGKLHKKDTYSALQPGMNSTEVYPAEVLFSPCGGFVLVSNRDATKKRRDGISVFSFDASSASLVFRQYMRVGWYPRSMVLTDDGLLVVGNQKDLSLSILKLNLESGKLTQVIPDVPVSNGTAGARSPAFVGVFDLAASCRSPSLYV